MHHHHRTTIIISFVVVAIPVIIAVIAFDAIEAVRDVMKKEQHFVEDNESLPNSEHITLQKGVPFLTSIYTGNHTAVIRNNDVEEQKYNASTVFALHLNSGQVLYEHNSRQVRPIASITKLMVAMIIVDEFEPSQTFTVSERATQTGAQSKVLGLKNGESITVEDALYGMLLESGNDVVVALEDYYNKQFSTPLVEEMNKRAKNFGLLETKFVEPTGLSDQNVSTAYEVTQLLKNVFEHPFLRTIMSTYAYTRNGVVWHNTNTLLDNENNTTNNRERRIIAGKTGYIEASGQSIALLGRTDSSDQVLMVVLHAHSDRIVEGQKLWRWIQQAYKWDNQ